ncbi:hypothetical protein PAPPERLAPAPP_05460 [Brevundimonas phage vB_BpoS-Papperlapapp]|uniref:Uncharacterized protein n=2 Tax=Marchewkavirus TaxID=3425052 RepID=A0A9E7SK00_9CAUD|nr:hypothetical protein KABACHOK_03830 [Brevundimonas phage vB_BpoS-Kabachok]USN14911.1 hypothetical protein DOMOVOI_04400 [Brevundimonas phage vB_BpoS-Domovoi]USN16284.1 hypothetical protein PAPPERLAPAPP_05460 [Brevundimonas phage vB_BpoS-Papperlapapp]
MDRIAPPAKKRMGDDAGAAETDDAHEKGPDRKIGAFDVVAGSSVFIVAAGVPFAKRSRISSHRADPDYFTAGPHTVNLEGRASSASYRRHSGV